MHKGCYKNDQALERHIRGQLDSSPHYHFPAFTGAPYNDVKNAIFTGLFDVFTFNYKVQVREKEDTQEEAAPEYQPDLLTTRTASKAKLNNVNRLSATADSPLGTRSYVSHNSTVGVGLNGISTIEL
jgi:flagellar basal body rod protein FlgC